MGISWRLIPSTYDANNFSDARQKEGQLVIEFRDELLSLIKELKKEYIEIAKSVGIDKDIILCAAQQESVIGAAAYQLGNTSSLTITEVKQR